MKLIAILKAWLRITPPPTEATPLRIVDAVLLEYMGAVGSMYLRADGQYHRITKWHNVSARQVWVQLDGMEARIIPKTTSVWCTPRGRVTA